VFGGWDAFPENAYDAAALTGVLEKEHLNAVREQLKKVRPFPAVFDPRYVDRIEAVHKKEYSSLREAAEQVREDIRTFKSEHGLDWAAMVNCASTEAYAQPQKAHFDVDEFEAALERSDPSISPAMVYAYAAL
jgi:myo-inositol-1-phosphate synthase